MSAWVELAVHLAHGDALWVKLVDDNLFVPKTLLQCTSPRCEKQTEFLVATLRALRFMLLGKSV